MFLDVSVVRAKREPVPVFSAPQYAPFALVRTAPEKIYTTKPEVLKLLSKTEGFRNVLKNASSVVVTFQPLFVDLPSVPGEFDWQGSDAPADTMKGVLHAIRLLVSKKLKYKS